MTLRTICGRRRTAVQSRRLIAGFYRFQRVGFSVVVLGLSVSLAAAEPAKRMFNIEAKPATQSLTDYARQAHTQLGYDVDVVNDILTNRVVGEYDSAEALKLLLEDTGLEAEHGKRGIFVRRVRKREVGSDIDIEERTPTVAETNSLQFAQTSAAEAQATVDQNQTSRRTETDSGEDEKKRPLEEIIVTGTNIRGIAPESSPMRTYTREDIQISGAATAQDFIQTLPANFRGGSNIDFPGGLPNDDNVRFNNGSSGSLGSSVNLRGLGSGATLVLLNGHRVAPSSGIGNFVDISMIPASAIERVDVLTDGASSIYGSDAVAGVTNFVLREDFEGVETTFRYGIGTQHRSPEEFRAGITGGLNWDSGHALVAYEYFNQDQIGAQDRSFSQDAPVPNYLRPSQERHSVLGTISQDVTSKLEVFADLTFARREAVSVFRQAFFLEDIFREAPTSENLNMSAGGTWNAADEWYVDFSGTYSEVKTESNQVGPTSSGARDTDSKVWVADMITSGSIQRLPGGDLKLAIGGHFRREDFNSTATGLGSERTADRDVYAFFGEAFIPIIGPENAVPGIERLELNASGRFDDYSDFGSTSNPKVGVLWSPLRGLRVRGTYSTSFAPPPLGRIGAADVQVAAFNTAVVNAVLGFTPADPSIADGVAITVTGTGKNLGPETSRAFTAGLDFDQQWNRHEIAASTTWFDIRFENRLGSTPIPGNRDFRDAPNIAFNDPGAFPEGTVIFFPSDEQIQNVLNGGDLLFTNTPPFFGDPFDARVINLTALVRNLGLTQVSGFDFSAMYTYELDVGNLTLGINGTYLQDFTQQSTVVTPAVEQINTLFNPVDLKLRGRVGFSLDGFAANIFVNYVNDYRADNTADAMRIDSWTTVDLSLSYDAQNIVRNYIFNDMVFRLSVVNLLDQDPPSTPNLARPGLGAGYDPTNASPLGRFVSFELTKRFLR